MIGRQLVDDIDGAQHSLSDRSTAEFDLSTRRRSIKIGCDEERNQPGRQILDLQRSRLRPFRYRYRIPVLVAVTVSGTVKVLNGTRYRHPDVGIGYWMSVSVFDIVIRYRHPLMASVGCRYRISISEPIPIPTSCLQDAWRDERRSIEIAMDVWRRCGGHEVHPIKKGARGIIKV